MEALYLVIRLPGWASSAATRAKRHPKIVMVDTGLGADLCGVGEADFGPRADGSVAGADGGVRRDGTGTGVRVHVNDQTINGEPHVPSGGMLASGTARGAIARYPFLSRPGASGKIHL